MARLFLSLPELDLWIQQGRASLSEDQLIAPDGVTYRLTAAVHFTAVAGDEKDCHQLLGRVKSKTQLAELGAEHYQDSVILGEVAYQVVEGFLGLPLSWASP